MKGLSARWVGVVAMGLATAAVLADDEAPPAPATPPAAPAPAPAGEAPAAPAAPTPPDPMTSSSVPMTAGRLDLAKRALSQAQAEYDNFIGARKAEFEAGAAYQAAKKAVDDDEKALAAAQAPLRAKLKSSDERYARAVEGLAPARQKYDEAVASKRGDDIRFRRLDLNRLEGVIQKAEAPLFEKDPVVQAAQRKLDADRRELTGMQAKFQKTLDENPDFAALSKAVNNAKLRVAAARGGQ